MPIIMGILATALAVYFFVIRARNAADMATDLVNVAGDVKAAARRFKFSRKHNQHPVDSIEDPEMAVAALGYAYANMDKLPTDDDMRQLDLAVQSALNVPHKDAEELLVLGRWFVDECGGAQPAITRLSKKLFKLGSNDSFQQVMEIIKMVSKDELTVHQKEALHDMKRAFRIT